jgi:hypothetical protein
MKIQTVTQNQTRSSAGSDFCLLPLAHIRNTPETIDSCKKNEIAAQCPKDRAKRPVIEA